MTADLSQRLAPDSLYLGETTGPDHERSGEPLLLDPSSLTTHGVIVGMTGSGKTGLGIGLVEEALLDGVPTLVIDPKGDLGNLLLTFPGLAPEDFAPWVEGADPAEVAASWKEGLASWGLDAGRIQQLRDAATFTIYTPGSTSGVGLNVVGSLQRPTAAESDPEATLDEITGYVSGLLGLVGIDADPLSSREHILLTNLIQSSWANGRDLDLPALVSQVQSPPLRKLGVFELDEFFPPAERTDLALRLNGLLASPAFAAWSDGDPIDIEQLLRPDGRTGCAIVSLSHLSDTERQFVVTLLLSKLITWMRSQPGTDQLRVLVYFDEVFGYVPPTQAPPSKASILTLLKQARAYGVGLVLATQNPVDLDYKALSNAGTWMIGRLQTEQDKARLLDGLAAASGGVDTKAVGDAIAELAKREFVLRRPGGSGVTAFTTRWVMSYLRGPLTREQITTLTADRRGSVAAGAAPRDPAQHDTTPAMPTVADGITVRWLDPAAPWASAVGADVTSKTFEAGIVATLDLVFDDTKADLRHAESVECVFFPLNDPFDPTALVAVDYDARDLRSEPPEGPTYRLCTAPIKQKGYFSAASTELVAHLLAKRTTTLSSNRELKLFSRPGEAPEEFALRCDAAADTGADAAAAKLTQRYQSRIARARDALAAAQDRLGQAEAVVTSRRNDELLSGAGDLLGSLLGRRGNLGGLARKAGAAARRRGRSSEASTRLGSAANRVEEKARALEDLEADLADELAAIADEWDEKAAAIEPYEVPLEKSDIRLTELALVWIPVA